MIDTRDAIMSAARSIVQAHGYAGLSFRDLATEVGVKSSSVHYHFPTKGDLATALAKHYSEETRAMLDAVVAESPDAVTCLRTYTGLFRRALENNNRMCLCGFLGAEYDDVPQAVRVEVQTFADINVAWLEGVLARIDTSAPATALKERALAIFAAIGGAQLAARSRGEIKVYDEIVTSFQKFGLIPA